MMYRTIERVRSEGSEGDDVLTLYYVCAISVPQAESTALLEQTRKERNDAVNNYKAINAEAQDLQEENAVSVLC